MPEHISTCVQIGVKQQGAAGLNVEPEIVALDMEGAEQPDRVSE